MDYLTKDNKSQDIEGKKPSLLKDYLVPFGSLVIPVVTYLTTSTAPWWGSLAIIVYVVIVLGVVVIPAILRVGKKWVAGTSRKRYEKAYFPKIANALRRFKPMMESSRTGTIWMVWEDGARTLDMKKFVRPNRSGFSTLAKWFQYLSKTVDSAHPLAFQAVMSETSDWVQQYVSFCNDAYSQYEELLRSNELDTSKIREIKQSWNHARDEHNQAVNNWKVLCDEINTSFNNSLRCVYYETLKPLE